MIHDKLMRQKQILLNRRYASVTVAQRKNNEGDDDGENDRKNGECRGIVRASRTVKLMQRNKIKYGKRDPGTPENKAK